MEWAGRGPGIFNLTLSHVSQRVSNWQVKIKLVSDL